MSRICLPERLSGYCPVKTDRSVGLLTARTVFYHWRACENQHCRNQKSVIMDETKEPGKEAGKENKRIFPEYCGPVSFDEMVPMDYHRRLLLTELLSRPENLSNGEL